MKRVVITGLGAVTPLGIGKEALWKGVKRGKSAVKRLTRFDASPLKSRIAAAVDDFDPAEYMDEKSVRRLDRFSQFAVASARLALDDAEMKLERRDGIGIGTYIGSALGGIGNAEDEHRNLVEKGYGAVNRLIALSVFGGAGAANVSIVFGLEGAVPLQRQQLRLRHHRDR